MLDQWVVSWLRDETMTSSEKPGNETMTSSEKPKPGDEL